MVRIESSGYIVKVFLLFLITISAVSATVSTTTTKNVQSEYGGAWNTTNGLTIIDKGISTSASTVSATATTCPLGANVTFGVSAGANSAIAITDYVFDVQVVTTALTPILSCFTVSLVITPYNSGQTTYSVNIASGLVIAPGQTLDCKFDIGSNLPTAPYSFLVKVQ